MKHSIDFYFFFLLLCSLIFATVFKQVKKKNGKPSVCCLRNIFFKYQKPINFLFCNTTDAKRYIILSYISCYYKDLGTSLQPVSNIFEHEQYEKSNEDFEVSILFWHNFQVLNKLIIFLCYCFMFKDQILPLESSHIPTLISVASVILYFYFFYHIFQSILK